MDTEKTTFMLALFGAFAWAPPILGWVHSCIQKPKLHFVPEEMVEIGYTTYGPIVNQFFAIATQKKDALIEKITLTVIHETGARHNFSWKFLDEKGPEITSMNTGERAEWRKNQSAIALKVSTLGLTEKKIGFQDIAFQNKLTLLTSKITETQAHLKRIKDDDYSKVMNSKEFIDLIDFVKSGFYWVEGSYEVHLFVHEVSLKKPHIEKFQFKLTKGNVESLSQNISTLEATVRDLVSKSQESKSQNLIWQWVYPTFSRK